MLLNRIDKVFITRECYKVLKKSHLFKSLIPDDLMSFIISTNTKLHFKQMRYVDKEDITDLQQRH